MIFSSDRINAHLPHGTTIFKTNAGLDRNDRNFHLTPPSKHSNIEVRSSILLDSVRLQIDMSR